MDGDASMSEWRASVVANVKDFQEESIRTVANEINSRKHVLLETVEALGPSLTNTDLAVRRSALQVVVSVLEFLRSDTLNQAEVETMAKFFCDRLKDNQTLHGLTIRGFVALVKMLFFPDDTAVRILNGMAGDVFVPTLPKTDRRNVYTMMDYMIERFESALQAMGSNLLMRCIAFMDGEHDPQNLVVAFSVMAKILELFEIEPLVEAAFDAVACYFPIDYTPTSGEDMESDLREVLTVGLRLCLVASPKFTKFLIPLLLEKLMSDSADAKEEALKTLTASCDHNPAGDVIFEQMPLLWPAVRREVLAAQSEAIETAALNSLTALTRCLSFGPQRVNDGIDKFIRKLIVDMEPFLTKHDLGLQYPAGKIFRAVSLGSPLVCGILANYVLPLGVKLFMEHAQSESRLAMMNVMALQLRTMAEMSRSAGFQLQEKDYTAAFYQSLLTETLQTMITCMAISGLAHMIRIRTLENEPFLEAHRVDQISEILMHGMMGYESTGVVDEVVHFFAVIGQEEDEHFIYGKLLPRLFEYIQNHEVLPIPSRLVDIATAVLKTPRPQRTSTFIPGLLERIRFLDENGPYVPTMKMYLDIIAVYVEGISSGIEAEYLYDLVLFPTFGKAIHAATSDDVSGYQDVTILQTLCRIYRGIVSRLDIPNFGLLVGKLDKMYLRGDTTYKHFTGGGRRQQLFGSAFKPLEKPYVTTHTRCISLMTSIVCSAPKGVIYSHDSWQAEVHKLVEACCFCADEQSSAFAAQCVAGILNRVEDDDTLNAFIADIFDDEKLARARAQERRLMRLVVWITKALVLASRRDDLIRKFCGEVVKFLRSQKSGEEAADGVRVILEDSSFVLNPQMNANISPLFRQRVFHVMMPMLLESFPEADNAEDAWIKKNHLVALSHLLKHVPHSVARPSMPKAIPYLLQSLSSDNADLLTSTLSSIEELLLDSDADSVSETLGTQSIPPLIDRLVELCMSSSGMVVRLAALKCLGFVSSQLPVAPLMPFKQKVLRRLSKVLDDKKRRVREMAVETRSAWFLVGSNKAA